VHPAELVAFGGIVPQRSGSGNNGSPFPFKGFREYEPILAVFDVPSFTVLGSPRSFPAMRLTPFLVLPLVACATITGGRGRAVEDEPPGSFVRSTVELRATRMIEVRPDLPRAQALKVTSDALAERYVVEVTDPKVGFLMTAWQASVMRGGVPDLRYRTRLVAKFVGDDWHALQLRSEANWARGEEWDIGYDVAQLDTVASELRNRLSRKP
jgi:hypothetical protein